MTEDTFPLAEMPLLTINDAGELPPSRLSRASDLRSGYVRCRDADITNSHNRALQQLLLDGEPPYDPGELRDANMADFANINFGGAEQQLERAMAPYYAMIQSPEDMVAVNTEYGASDERTEWNTVLSEEMSRTIRESRLFSFWASRLAKWHVWDGISFLYWPDDRDWRFRSAGLGFFRFPRQTLACEDEVEVVYSLDDTYSATKLFSVIANPERAAKDGWNVEAVKNAIRVATSNTPIYQEWERLADEMKNNDISVSQNMPVTRCLNAFVKEFDGTVSHYICTEVPGLTGENEFLYVGRSKFRNMREILIMFPYGLGTNAKIHGIRGLGYKIYPFEQQRNRSLSRLIDQGYLSSSLMLQPEGEEALADIGLQYFGNTAVIDPNCKVVPYPAPDLQRTVMPVLEEMERLRNDRVSQYTAEGAFDGDQRKTKYEISAKLQSDAKLSGTALDFWCGPFEVALQQVVRRMTRRTYVRQDPGGEEIADLHLRLVKRGVPLEALYLIDWRATKFSRSIGAGSAAAATLALDQLNDLRPRMDDVGQARLDRALAVNLVGAARAEDFFPRDLQRRTTADTQIAILQNTALLNGEEIPVLSSDKHLAHAREHIKPLLEGFQAVEQGQAPIEEIGPRMGPLFDHAVSHVEYISGDPSVMEEAAALRQALQQIGEVVSNGIRKAQTQAAKAQEEQGAEGGSAPAGPDAKMLADVEMAREKLRQSQEAHQIRMQQLVETAQTKRAIADADAAARINREAAAARSRDASKPVKPAKTQP